MCSLIATRCCQYWESISKETYISSYVTWTKVTAHPAIGLFSDYIREGARIAQRKEKRESRRKTFQRGKSRLSIFRKVAEYNPSLKMAENMFTERHLTRRFMALASSNFSSMLLTFYFLSNGKENARQLFFSLPMKKRPRKKANSNDTDYLQSWTIATICTS